MTAPTIHFEAPGVTLWHGDCIETMRLLPDASVDAVCTDPPYALEFMGREWDGWASPAAFQQWCTEWAAECLRVLKPGGHLLAFGGSRTWHRLAAGIEDAGFEIRDSIAWLYGSGFPKSLDVSKAIDKAAGAVREVVSVNPNHRADSGVAYAGIYSGGNTGSATITAPASPEAQQWEGWGTALKPAFEPIVAARKPLIGTVAANVLAYGTGALNIDASRVHGPGAEEGRVRHGGGIPGNGSSYELADGGDASPAGRWPTNVLLDPSQAAALDAQTGVMVDGTAVKRNTQGASKLSAERATSIGEGMRTQGDDVSYGGFGGGSRFFPTFRYEAKAGGAERPKVDGVQHPTVKPRALMEWLIRLVTPPGGTVLEPFAGSGTTLEAAVREGFSVIGIEREASYLPLIVHRLTERDHQQSLFGDWDES